MNDIIVKVGDKDIKKASDVIDQINQNGITKSINISIKRGNKLVKINVKPTDISNLSNR